MVRMTYRLLYDSKHAAFDVSDGLSVDRRQLVYQPVVQRQERQVEEQTLSHCLLSPGSSHLCVNRQHRYTMTYDQRGELLTGRLLV